LRVFRPGESWSQLRKLIERSNVSLNDIVCVDEARRLRTGDVIGIGERSLTPPPSENQVKIQYVDAHVVVVEKPAGMMTHRRPEEQHWSAKRKAQQPTLDECLNEILNEDSRLRRSSSHRLLSVRCVHRLDRDTSGLLVFARNSESADDLIDQFRRHEVHRVYWAVVHGVPEEGTIVSYIARDRGDGRRGSTGNPKIGQRAVTHIRLMERWGAGAKAGSYSLVECRLETGRTNQIRIHMAEKGHLVCGDVKYRQPFAAAAFDDCSGAPRLALHAAELGFRHPVSQEFVYFTMPFPVDLQQFAERIRQF